MTDHQIESPPDREREFAQAAGERRRSFVAELWQFARENKKWWLIPVFAILFLVGFLVLLGSTGAGPLIYPLF